MHHPKKSSTLIDGLRQAAHEARLLTARTVGTGCIVLGSFIVKSLVGALPGESAPPDSPSPARPEATHTPTRTDAFKGAA